MYILYNDVEAEKDDYDGGENEFEAFNKQQWIDRFRINK